MSFIKKAILLLILVLAFFAYNNVNAQEDDFSQRPKITIRNLEVDKDVYTEGETLKIKFDVENKDNIVYPDVYAETRLVSDFRRGNIQPTKSYDLEISAPLTIDREGSSFELSYTLPPGIYGEEYGIELKLTEKTGLPLTKTYALFDINDDISLEGQRFEIVDANIQKNGEVYGLHEGPYFANDEDVILNINISPYTYDDNFTPILKLSEYSEVYNYIYEKELDYTFNNNTISMVIEKPEYDGVFVGNLTLVNEEGQKIASPITFRFIKGDTIATIHSVSTDKQHGYKGEMVKIDTAITGQPLNIDTLETQTDLEEVFLQIVLRDHNDKQVGYAEKTIFMEPNNAISAGVVLEKDARFISANIKISDLEGDVIDEYSVDLSEEVVPFYEFYKNQINILVFAVLLIIILVLIFFLKKNKEKDNKFTSNVPTAALVLLFLVSSGLLVSNVSGYVLYNPYRSGSDSYLGSFIDTRSDAVDITSVQVWEKVGNDLNNYYDFELSDGFLRPRQYFTMEANVHVSTCGNSVGGRSGDLSFSFTNNGQDYTGSDSGDGNYTSGWDITLLFDNGYAEPVPYDSDPTFTNYGLMTAPSSEGYYSVDLRVDHAAIGYDEGYIPYKVVINNQYCPSSELEVPFVREVSPDQFYAYIPPIPFYPSGAEFTVPDMGGGLPELERQVRRFMTDEGFVEATSYSEPQYLSGYWDTGYMCFEAAPPPTLDLQAEGPGDADYTNNPESINVGQSVTLRWTGSNVATGSCSINQGIGSVGDPTAYKYNVGPTTTTTYTISCTGTNGDPISDSIQITVNQPAPSSDPLCSGGVTGSDYYYVKTNADYNFKSADTYGYDYSWSHSGNGSSWTSGLGFKNALADKVTSDYGSSYGDQVRNLDWPTLLTCSVANSRNLSLLEQFICTSTEDLNPKVLNYPTVTYNDSLDIGNGFAIDYSCVQGSGTNNAFVDKSYTWAINITPPNPTVDIKANGQDSLTITEGNSVNLTWAGTNTVQGYLTRNVTSPLSLGSYVIPGNKTYYPAVTTTYSMVANSAYNSSTANDSVTVTVNPAPIPADCGVADYRNGDWWTTYSSSAAFPSGDLCGTGNTINSNPVQYTENNSSSPEYQQRWFWWSCRGSAGDTSTCFAPKTPSISLIASPNSITRGQSSNLALTTENLENCSSPQSGFSPSVSSPLYGTTNYSVSPTTTTNYQVTCQDTWNGANYSANADVNVGTVPATLSLLPATQVISEGKPATLNYSGTNIVAGSCSVTNGIGGVPGTSGSFNTPNLTSNASYTITCTRTEAAGGISAGPISASASVTVIPAPACGTASWEDGWNFYSSVTNFENSTDDGDLCSVGTVNPRPAEYVDGTSNMTNFWWQCRNGSNIATCYALKTPTASCSPSSQNITRGSSASISLLTQNIGSCSSPQSDLNSQLGDVNTPLTNTDVSSVSPLSSTVYNVNCTSGYGFGDGASCSSTVNVGTVTATLDLRAKGTRDSVYTNIPATINPGDKIDLRWTGSNVESCSINQGIGNVVNPTGYWLNLFPSANITYTITCNKTVAAGGGTIIDSINITVQTLPASISLTPETQEITRGTSATLNYTGSNIVSGSCFISGGIGAVTGTSGSATTPSVISNNTYTITCTRTAAAGGGSVNDTATVTVNTLSASLDMKGQGPNDPAPTDTPSTLTIGESIDLTWTSSEIEPGTCTLSGSSVSDPTGSSTKTPGGDFTYVLSCTKTAAAGGGTISDSVSVTTYPQPTVNLKVNGSDGPVTIDYEQLARITWSSTNSASCTGTNFNTLSAQSGTSDKYPSATVTYSVTCTSTFGNGETATDSVVVNVNAPTTPPACGAADGETLFNHPADPQLCSVGSSNDTADSAGQFNWECTQPGFPNQSCSATDISGVCGSDENGFFQSAPSGSNLCATGATLSGSVGTVTVSGKQYWDWQCQDGLGTVSTTDCRAYKMPVCNLTNPDNPYTCTLGTESNQTADDDRFLWTCTNDYTGVTDIKESVDCILNCPVGEIVVGTTCENVGNVTIDVFEPTEKVINKGDDCEVNWELTSTDPTASITCDLSGDATGSFPYTGANTYNGTNITPNVQSRVSYTLTCTVDGVPVIPGETQDVAQTSCIINPDIDEI